MLGPEKIPYGSLGAYANTVSATYNLNSWQATCQFLINDIPEKDLPTISQKTYSQTAAYADKPDSPNYYGALESLVWAEEIENRYRNYSSLMGALGAVAGGAVGVTAMSAYSYNSYQEAYASGQAVSTEEDRSFISASADISLLMTPILAAGIVGAYAAKKCTPSIMKLMARRVVKRIKASEADPEVGAPDVEAPLLLGEESEYPATAGNHLETVEEGQLYQIAKRWANLRGCDDEQKYADFLVAEMPPREVTALIRRTGQRCTEVIDDTSNLTRQDVRYTNLLHDAQIAKAIIKRRSETRNMLKKVYRGVGYLGAICFFGLLVSNPTETDTPPPSPSHADIFLVITSLTVATAFTGGFLGRMFANKADFLTQQRSKRLAAKASNADY